MRLLYSAANKKSGSDAKPPASLAIKHYLKAFLKNSQKSVQHKKQCSGFLKSAMVVCFIVTGLSKSYSQTFTSRTGYIGFFSKTPLENIKAENRQAFAAIDTDKKNLAFMCLVKGFLFQKELMQEHFNENYIESDQYPKASFTGNYTGDVNTKKDGVYNVLVKGQLTLHGVTKTIEIPATLESKGDKLVAISDFKITPADYNIKIPALVREKIAKQMDVHVLAECNPK